MLILAVATRSADKLREIEEILRPFTCLRLASLDDLGVAADPAEEHIEQFDTFEQNALAKARFFASRTGMTTLADDSGLCVDALDGAPGVWSKRFSGRHDLRGAQLDESNNDKLLAALRDVPPVERTARYVCVAAVASPEREERCFRGTVEGSILTERCGTGGFGYDPLFFVPTENASFARVAAERKNAISHRAQAMRAMGRSFCEPVDIGAEFA